MGYDEWLEFKPSSSCHCCKQYIIRADPSQFRILQYPFSTPDFQSTLFTTISAQPARPQAKERDGTRTNAAIIEQVQCE